MLTSMLTFVNVFESCTQDSCTMVAVMSNVLERLKEIIPALKSVYYWQDNAGCYHCGSTIVIAELCGRRNKFNIPSFSVPQLTNLDKESQVGQSEFLTVNSKKKSQKEDASQPENSPVSTYKEDTTYNQNERHLYSYPEPGCIKRYQRFSSLQRHLDCGKHKREKETLFDRAATGYAERLDKQSGCVPRLQAFQSAKSPRQHVLSTGWALKCAQTKRTRFNDKQKNYMTTKFNIGETTCRL